MPRSGLLAYSALAFVASFSLVDAAPMVAFTVEDNDYNSDSRTDLLAINEIDGTLWLYPGTGRGSFRPPILVGSGWTTYVLAT